MANGGTAEQEAGFRALLSGVVPDTMVFDPVTEEDARRGGNGCLIGCLLPTILVGLGLTRWGSQMLEDSPYLCYGLLAMCVLGGFFLTGWLTRNEFYELNFKTKKLELRVNSHGRVRTLKSWRFNEIHRFTLDLPSEGQDKSALYAIFKSGQQIQLVEGTYTREFLNGLIARLHEALEIVIP